MKNANRKIGRLSSSLAMALLLCAWSLLLFDHALGRSIIEDAVEQSTFIFKGTVTRLGAATMPVIPVSTHTIVVKVDEVLEAPTLLGDYTGKQITVHVKVPAVLQVGHQAIFFTKGWLLGESLAVQEVGQLTGGTAVDLRKEITAARRSIADRDLQKRIASADLVVAGKIAEVRARAEPARPRRLTEHDPQWQEAILEAATVLKGDATLKKILVIFPGTLDIAWVSAPKFTVGQEGIWILQRDAKLQAHTALDPLDCQPKDQLDRVRELLKRATP